MIFELLGGRSVEDYWNVGVGSGWAHTGSDHRAQEKLVRWQYQAERRESHDSTLQNPSGTVSPADFNSRFFDPLQSTYSSITLQ